ncbi:MAG: sigma-54-dependent Fis family transcriptional regulator [Deltaproteobacteria bacterium]|nr:sigma-54-dependent Fis family transcriptional regulator [Deltaproteobacteria bacterium]
MSDRVLVVDDDEAICSGLVRVLSLNDFDASSRTSANAALAFLEETDVDVVVTDVQLGGMDGLTLCRRIVENRPELPVIVITGRGTLDTAIEAIRVGACDFLQKPFDFERLLTSLRRALDHRWIRSELKRLPGVSSNPQVSTALIGESPAIQEISELIERVASTDTTLLVVGESGTGKDLVARAIHSKSRRAEGPFVAINCAAVPESLIESELFGHVKGAFTDARVPRRGLFLNATGGTLFLDEVGELPLSMQPKLLRALQEKTVRPVGSDREEPYQARIVAATNRNLEAEVQAHRFREDLYYRINVVRIPVPPLRARGHDMLLLAQHFLEKYALEMNKPVTGLSPAVAEKLVTYGWPGNVRELQNCIERAVTFARFGLLIPDDLPEKVRDFRPADRPIPELGPNEVVTMEELERRYILRVIDQLAGNKTAAADALGMDRRTLHRKLERYLDRSKDESSR